MKRFFIFSIYSIVFGFSFAQNFSAVQLNGEVVPAEIRFGRSGKWIITLKLASEVYIGDATSGMFFVKPKLVEGIRFGSPVYQKGIRETYGNVYRGKVVVEIPLFLESSVKSGEHLLTAEVQIQPCGESDGICYPPEMRSVTTSFTVLASEDNEFIVAHPAGISGKLYNALERGSFLAFFLVFVGGLLTSLTPCVYPMIPITVAVIGAQASGGKLKGFVLSLFYVLGIALTFSGLGILAAKTGSLFGTYSQHPIVLILISLIFFSMGLSMLGVFVLQMPASLAGRLRGKRRSGYIGAILTGLVAGLIVSPCISPLLVVILAWVAKTGNVVLGFGLLFSFAFGLGVLFILIGTFSGVLKNLPKSGGWTDYIEKIFGISLVVLSIYFLRTVVGPLFYQGLWAVFLFFLGTFLGGLAPLDQGANRKRKIGKAFGLLAMVVSTCLIFFGFARHYGFLQMKSESSQEQVQKEDVFWIRSDEQGFAQAKTSGEPIIMDFFADWCAACKELDEKTWSNASVQGVMLQWIRIKMDLSRQTEKTTDIQKRYNIIGIPTVILFNPEGKEIDRFTGFKKPDEVMKFIGKYARTH